MIKEQHTVVISKEALVELLRREFAIPEGSTEIGFYLFDEDDERPERLEVEWEIAPKELPF